MVWPDSVRPLRSVIVTEISTGISTPFSSNTSRMATSAALAFSVSTMVSTQDHVGAAVDEAARLLLEGVAQRLEGDRAQRRVVHVRRDRQHLVGRADRAGDEARLVRRLRGPGRGHAPGDARALDVHLVDVRLEAVVALGDGGRAERVGLDEVGAGGEVGVVDAGHDVGLRQHQDVGVALQVVAVIGEAGAAVVGIREAVPLHHRPHRAIEDEDAAGEERVERGADIGHDVSFPWRARRRTGRRPARHRSRCGRR